MATSFSNFSDDFFVNADLNTSLTLPRERETVLHFCESVQKEFADLTDFYQREAGAHVLEGNRQSGSYRWMEIDTRRLASGSFNPDDMDEAYRLHRWILDRSRYFLGISHLDVESLDLVYGFNLDYVGNRDAIICDALVAGTPLGTLISEAASSAISFEPSLIVAVDEECSLQARMAIETRNSSYQVRTGNYEQEPISVYFTIRAHPRPGERFDPTQSLPRQREIGEDLLGRVVIPQIVCPIASAIAAAQ